MSRSRLPLVLPLLVAVAVLAELVLLWSGRLFHPFDLEWMEGGMLVHAWRLQHDLPLYPAPDRDWIPYIYPAGYASLLASLGEVFGLDYVLGRVISLLGSLAAAGAIVRLVHRQIGRPGWGLVGAALFLGTYTFSGTFFDLVRLDGLMMGLLAWSLVLGMERERGALEASALLLVAAFLVKQHVAVFGLPMALGIARRDGWGRALRFAAWSALPALALTALLHLGTGGYYLHYLLGVPAHHGVVGARIFPGTPRELAYAMVIALPVASLGVAARTAELASRRGLVWGLLGLAAAGGATALLLLPQVRGTTNFVPWLLSSVGGASLGLALAAVLIGVVVGRWRGLSWRWIYGIGVGGLILVGSAVMRGHVGGYLNVHMQLHWVVAAGAAVVAARAVERTRRAWVPWVLGLLLAAQLGWHLAALLHGEPPVPPDSDRAAGQRVVDLLEEAPGPVWSPFAPWLAVQAGHEPRFHLIALWDIDRERGPLRSGVDDLHEAIDTGWYGTIVNGTRMLKHGVPQHYEPAVPLPLEPWELRPVTGWQARPSRLDQPVGDAP